MGFLGSADPGPSQLLPCVPQCPHGMGTGRGRSGMDTGPKAEGKASNPAKPQLQVRAKLRAGLILPQSCRCQEYSRSSRRFFWGRLEGLRKSSRDGSTQDTATKRLALPGQAAQSSSGKRNRNLYVENIELNNASRAQGMAASKTIQVNFTSLPLLVIPPFFSSWKDGNFCL